MTICTPDRPRATRLRRKAGQPAPSSREVTFGDWHVDLIPPKDVVATRLYLASGVLFPTTPV